MSLHTVMFATYSGTSNRVGNSLAILFLFCFVTFYGGALDATPYIYCSEIFPTNFRAQGVGFSISALFITNICKHQEFKHQALASQMLTHLPLVYTCVAPTAFRDIGWRYYLVFIIVPVIGLGGLLKFYPETRGLTLEEVSLVTVNARHSWQ